MGRRLVGVALAAALLPVGLTACTSGGSDSGVTSESGFVGSSDATVLLLPPEDREPAPELAGTLIGGGDFALSDVRGDDVVVVNVWGSWCAPCRAEAATLETVYRDVEDQGVLFVGLNTRDEEAQALAFLDRFDVSYPNLDDNDARLQLAFRTSLPSAAIPTTWVIDREGRVAARTLSGVTEERLRGMLDAVLAESPAAGSPATDSGASDPPAPS